MVDKSEEGQNWQLRDQLEDYYGIQEGYDDVLVRVEALERKKKTINVGYNLEEESNRTC